MQTIKIISGGQTGVDRAALDFALIHGIPCGGYCPRFRKAEDGTIPTHYPMIEMNAVGYPARTRKNITAGDGTLILYFEKADQGTLLTIKLCKILGKPFLIQKN